jgi:nucleolar protein 12
LCVEQEDLEVQRALAHAARLRQVSAAKAGKPAATVESVQPRKRKHVEETSDAEDDDEESDDEADENQSYGLTEEEAERLFADIHSDDEEPSKEKKKFDVKTVKTTDGVADADSIRTNKKANQHNNDDRTGRTIFVGNVPITVTPKALKAVFRPFGAVESVRFRSVAFDTTDVPRKVAFIQKKFHSERDSMNAYVVFVEAAGATAALAFNGKEIEGKVVRVDLADNSKKHEDDKSVFVGSLPFDCTGMSFFEEMSSCWSESLFI